MEQNSDRLPSYFITGREDCILQQCDGELMNISCKTDGDQRVTFPPLLNQLVFMCACKEEEKKDGEKAGVCWERNVGGAGPTSPGLNFFVVQ